MQHLRLIINNEKNKKTIFFDKSELQIILNLYAKMVSTGEWKDYGLSISKREVSFNVYHRTSDIPVYKITKSLKPKNANEKYLIKDSNNRVIKNSENLQSLITKIIWKEWSLISLSKPSQLLLKIPVFDEFRRIGKIKKRFTNRK